MQVRELIPEDAPLMLEWMHDEDVVRFLRGDFKSKTIEDCEAFITSSISEENKSFAIVSDANEYMGTVTLRNIKNRSAEFAITVRSAAMSRGYSWFGMDKILDLAFNELNLEFVYWCVSKHNVRAIRFYDKHGFQRMDKVSLELTERYMNSNNGINDLIWYSVSKNDIRNEEIMSLKHIPEVKGDR